MKYRIWLEEIPANEKGNPVVPGSWFICQGSRQNEYIYDRSDDSSDRRIRYYDCRGVVEEMRNMRRLGYWCKSDPSFTLTEAF
jgi:hypothetical protein